MRVQANMRIII